MPDYVYEAIGLLVLAWSIVATYKWAGLRKRYRALRAEYGEMRNAALVIYHDHKRLEDGQREQEEVKKDDEQGQD
jgi:hypothetical protein